MRHRRAAPLPVEREPTTEIDIDLARAGALLHDIGVYRLYDDAGNLDGANYIRHGILGYELLQEEGLPEVDLPVRLAPHRGRAHPR